MTTRKIDRRLLVAAASVLLLAACGNSSGGRENPDAVAGEVTFAKSFGGPGADAPGVIAVDATGQIIIGGIYQEPGVPAAEAPIWAGEYLNWLIGLDRLGDPRWQMTPSTPSGVVDGGRYRFGEPLLDGGAVYAGLVSEPRSGNGEDIFIQRIDPASNAVWTQVLDSGSASSAGPIEDALQAVIGNESIGWWVVADTLVDERVPDTGNGRTVLMNVPSVVVWFVQPDGTVRWQRRIAAPGNPSPGTRTQGPFFRAATLATVNGTETLAMTLSNLEPNQSFDANLTVVFLDSANNLNVGAETLTNPNGYTTAQHPTDHLLIQTSDAVNGAIDTVPDDGFLIARQTSPCASANSCKGLQAEGYSHLGVEITKVDRSGAKEWELEFRADRFDDFFVSSVAQTFPSSTPSWLWVGGSLGSFQATPLSRNASGGGQARLWRIDLTGQLSRTCGLNGYTDVLAMTAADITGAELRVLAHSGGVPDELIVDENCQVLSTTPLTAEPQRVPGTVPAVSGLNAPRWLTLAQRTLVIPVSVPWNPTRYHGGRNTRIGGDIVELALVEAADSVRRIAPPGRRNFERPQDVAVAAGPRGRLVAAVSDETEHELVEIDEFGSVTRVLSTDDPMNPVYDAAGRLWLMRVFGIGDLLEVAADGSTTMYRYNGTDTVGLRGVRAAPGGGLETVWWRTGGSDEMVSIGADGTASVRPLDVIGADPFYTADLDVLGTARAFQSHQTVVHYGAIDQEGWSVTIPDSSKGGEIAGIRLKDAVIAHDGGMVLLLEFDAFELPGILTDPPGTYGDRDIALLKINGQGLPQWLRVFGAAGNEDASDLERTTVGYAVLAKSDSLDAVTPGTEEIWVLQTGVDGHIQADASGNDLCQACLGSVSGQALLDLLSLGAVAVPALPSATPTTLESGPGPVFEVRVPERSDLLSVNTARQCFGDATDIQEAAVAPTAATQTLAVAVFTDGSAMGSGNPVGGLVTSMPPGINCDVLASSDCSEPFAEGSTVTLSAVAREGYRFDRWESDDAAAACNGAAGADVDVTVDSSFECRAYFVTVSSAVEDVSINFDSTIGRVVDVNTGLLDCTTNCTVPLPVNASPIQLRAINGATSLALWVGCDSELPDPNDPNNPNLCEIDITNGPRMVDAIFQ